jgi:hypothetical protein
MLSDFHGVLKNVMTSNIDVLSCIFQNTVSEKFVINIINLILRVLVSYKLDMTVTVSEQYAEDSNFVDELDELITETAYEVSRLSKVDANLRSDVETMFKVYKFYVTQQDTLSHSETDEIKDILYSALESIVPRVGFLPISRRTSIEKMRGKRSIKIADDENDDEPQEQTKEEKKTTISEKDLMKMILQRLEQMENKQNELFAQLGSGIDKKLESVSSDVKYSHNDIMKVMKIDEAQTKKMDTMMQRQLAGGSIWDIPFREWPLFLKKRACACFKKSMWALIKLPYDIMKETVSQISVKPIAETVKYVVKRGRIIWGIFLCYLVLCGCINVYINYGGRDLFQYLFDTYAGQIVMTYTITPTVKVLQFGKAFSIESHNVAWKDVFGPMLGDILPYMKNFANLAVSSLRDVILSNIPTVGSAVSYLNPFSWW